MLSFDTPEPISAVVRVDAGSVRFVASDRPDTVVEVRPRDPDRDQDVRSSDQTEVTYASGVLAVSAPRLRYLFPRTGCVDVTVELPAGSRVELAGASPRVLGEGRLGEVRVKTSTGDVRLDATGPLQLTASHGTIIVGQVEGRAEITAGSRGMRVGTVDGPAHLKSSHGTTTVGTVTGDLRVTGANGDIEIGRAEGSVHAATAHGTLRVAEVARGTVELETASGSIEVGIREGVPAWLDLTSDHGRTGHALTACDAPEHAEETVHVRARSRWGDIDVRRAPSGPGRPAGAAALDALPRH